MAPVAVVARRDVAGSSGPSLKPPSRTLADMMRSGEFKPKRVPNYVRAQLGTLPKKPPRRPVRASDAPPRAWVRGCVPKPDSNVAASKRWEYHYQGMGVASGSRRFNDRPSTPYFQLWCR